MGTPPAPDPDPDALKRARERRGLSQTDVARLLGVPAADRNQVARWEHGAHTPQLHYQPPASRSRRRTPVDKDDSAGSAHDGLLREK
jgi:hypothetical protein